MPARCDSLAMLVLRETCLWAVNTHRDIESILVDGSILPPVLTIRLCYLINQPALEYSKPVSANP